MDPPLEYRGPSGTSWNHITAAVRSPSVSEPTEDALEGLVLPHHREDLSPTSYKPAVVRRLNIHRFDKWIPEPTALVPRARMPNPQTRTTSNSAFGQYPLKVTSLRPRSAFQVVSSPRVRFRIEEFPAEERIPQKEREQCRRPAKQPVIRAARMEVSRTTTPNDSSPVFAKKFRSVPPSFTGAMIPLSTSRSHIQPDPPSAGDADETSSSASDEYSEASSRTGSTDYGIYCRRMAYEYSQEL